MRKLKKSELKRVYGGHCGKGGDKSSSNGEGDHNAVGKGDNANISVTGHDDEGCNP